MRNWRLEPTGLGKPVETRGFMGTGPDLALQESEGRVVWRVWSQTDPFLQSKPGPLVGYPDPLPTLLGCHHYVLKINLHRRCKHYDTFKGRGREPRVNVQHCVGYRLCFETRGVVLCKSHDIEIGQDAASVFCVGGNEFGGVAGEKGYINLFSCDLIHILHQGS